MNEERERMGMDGWMNGMRRENGDGWRDRMRRMEGNQPFPGPSTETLTEQKFPFLVLTFAGGAGGAVEGRAPEPIPELPKE